jgi:hypothetical protein
MPNHTKSCITPFINDSQQWQGTLIHIGDDAQRAAPNDQPAPTHWQSATGSRARLVLHDRVLLWLKFESNHYGVNVLKARAEETSMPWIDADTLRSSQIEAIRAKPVAKRFAAWAQVFAEQLLTSAHSMLYPGHWMLGTARPQPNQKRWTYGTDFPFRHRLSRCVIWQLDKVEETLTQNNNVFCDWFVSPDYKIITLRDVDQDAGRVRWWRKKIREGSLPPVLLWYVSCLCSYVLIDGHDRLAASIAEGVAPDFVILHRVEAHEREPDVDTQAAITKSLEARALNPRKRELDVNSLNDIVLAAYENRPWYLTELDTAWPKRFSNAQWNAEIRARLSELGLLGELENFGVD